MCTLANTEKSCGWPMWDMVLLTLAVGDSSPVAEDEDKLLPPCLW